MRFWLAALLCASCVDKGKADFDRCVERDRSYDVPGAYSACAAAVAADPKSASGEAAQRKLRDLQVMLDNMKAEQADKAARDDAIKRASEVAASNSATPQVADSAQTAADSSAARLATARALKASGDLTMARAVLETRAYNGTASTDEVTLLLSMCKQQHDKTCIKKINAAKH